MAKKINYKLKGLHHPAFATKDLDKTIEFWRDLLGFRLILGMSYENEKQYFFAISPTMMVAFFEWKEVEPAPYKRHGAQVKGPYVFDHFAIQVESENDLWNLQDQLIAAAFPVSDMIDHGFVHSIYTFDPNGIPLEFNVAVSEIDLFQTPLIADKNASKIALEGPDPKPGKWPTTDDDNDEDRIILPGVGNDLF